jgi:uncharacterized membrane protein YcjF (UPF0283 family)
MNQPSQTPATSTVPAAQGAQDFAAEIDALNKRLDNVEKNLKKPGAFYRYTGLTSFCIIAVVTVILIAGAWLCMKFGIKDHDLWAFVAVYAIFASTMVAVLCVFAKSLTDDY